MPIGRLIQLFTTSLSDDSAGEKDHREAIELATAAILLEVAHAGSQMGDDEKRQVDGHLARVFGLSDEAAGELMSAADQIRSDTIDHFELTNRIRQTTSVSDRMEMVRAMWRIVYADGKFHQYEGYLVRKLADLMGIEHNRMIGAKMEVRKELGIED